jgi:hypothetical protein
MKILGEHDPPIIIILETKEEMKIMKELVGLFHHEHIPGRIPSVVLNSKGMLYISYSMVDKFVDKIYDFLGWRTEDEILS